MVVVVLGFGAFLLDTLFIAQVNLLRELRVDKRENRPNLALFDIQRDQSVGVAESLKGDGLSPEPPVPIVPMRIFSVKGTPAANILEASSKEHRQSGMGVLRREYRSTYRDALTSGERSVGGQFWDASVQLGSSDVVPISLERDLARELGVGLGDEIVWDVQGLLVRSRVRHFRELRWARFEPNF